MQKCYTSTQLEEGYMQTWVDYGWHQARSGMPSSLVRMLNESFRYYRRLVPAPKDDDELKIYILISKHKDLDPDLREIMEKIVFAYCGS